MPVRTAERRLGERVEQIIGDSPAMRGVFAQIEEVARFDVTVLVTGESGTGKDLVAQQIHRLSARSAGPYYPVNMGAIPRELAGSTLFGHEKGSFTGANQQQKGMFEAASGGTLFLDEIGTMEEMTQVSLLRVIETQRFQRIGGTHFLRSDVRLVAASNLELEQAVREGEFRGDLFHRLNVFHIKLPPLRERDGDVTALARHFMQRYSAEFDKRVERLEEEAVRMLRSYQWPGNVRELENVIMRAVITAPGDSITPDLLKSPVHQQAARKETITLEFGTRLADAERALILLTLEKVAGNKLEAARVLGISRKGIYNKLKKYGL